MGEQVFADEEGELKHVARRVRQAYSRRRTNICKVLVRLREYA